MLVSFMVGYDEISLSQSFVALKGYVDAIQLVMISAVPPLKEVVVQNEHAVVIESDSEIEKTSKDHMDMYTYRCRGHTLRCCQIGGHSWAS